MSVFADESLDDSSYAHLSQPAPGAGMHHDAAATNPFADPYSSVPASGSSPAPNAAPRESVAGTNPFGGGDGFAGTAPRSASNSMSAVAVETGHGSSAPSQPQSSPTSNPFASEAESQASSGSAAASSSPATSPAASSGSSATGLSDVPTGPEDRLAALAAQLPSYSMDSGAELDDRHSKHGKIAVGEPELRGGKLRGYHVYRVSSAASTVEHVFRRYSDFVWLRTVLVKSFPGVFIPPLPEKKLVGNKEQQFVEARRLDLQRWLQRVVVRQFLAEHEAVNLFLQRATASFDEEAKALTKTTEARQTHEIVATYMDLFPELARLPPNPQANLDVEALAEFLRQSEQKMGLVQNAAERFVATKQGAATDLSKVNAAMQANFELERAFVASPPASVQARGGVLPRINVCDSFAAWGLSVKWSANALEDLWFRPLKFELQDIHCMQECVKIRTDLYQKWMKSVSRAAKWEAPGGAPKNEKQEAQRSVDEATARDEGLLLDLCNKLILHAQFEQFWQWSAPPFPSPRCPVLPACPSLFLRSLCC